VFIVRYEVELYVLLRLIWSSSFLVECLDIMRGLSFIFLCVKRRSFLPLNVFCMYVHVYTHTHTQSAIVPQHSSN
jgi:hypothetical protein